MYVQIDSPTSGDHHCERVDLSGLCECGWSTDRLCTEPVLCLEHSSPVICVGVYGATCTLQWFISA